MVKIQYAITQHSFSAKCLGGGASPILFQAASKMDLVSHVKSMKPSHAQAKFIAFPAFPFKTLLKPNQYVLAERGLCRVVATEHQSGLVSTQ